MIASGSTAFEQNHLLHRLQITSGGTATKQNHLRKLQIISGATLTKPNHLLHRMQITSGGTDTKQNHLFLTQQVTSVGTANKTKQNYLHKAQITSAIEQNYLLHRLRITSGRTASEQNHLHRLQIFLEG